MLMQITRTAVGLILANTLILNSALAEQANKAPEQMMAERLTETLKNRGWTPQSSADGSVVYLPPDPASKTSPVLEKTAKQAPPSKTDTSAAEQLKQALKAQGWNEQQAADSSVYYRPPANTPEAAAVTSDTPIDAAAAETVTAAASTENRDPAPAASQAAETTTAAVTTPDNKETGSAANRETPASKSSAIVTAKPRLQRPRHRPTQWPPQQRNYRFQPRPPAQYGYPAVGVPGRGAPYYYPQPGWGHPAWPARPW